MSKRSLLILMVLGLLGWAGGVTARELKLGYIDSDRILQEFDEYKQARQQLDDEQKGYTTQATAMEDIAKKMYDELQAQSLMLSNEARAERENRLREKQKEIDDFKKETWGEGGKLYTRNLELSRPVLEKINTAIEKVSKEESYDFVFDAVSANIVYAQPEYDLTDKVLAALNKE